MNGPRGYYVKQSKSVRERQILSDITYMWNLKSETNDQMINQNGNRLKHTESKLVVARGEECGGMGLRGTNFQS